MAFSRDMYGISISFGLDNAIAEALSWISRPLPWLNKKDQPFQWEKAERDSFSSLKTVMVATASLVHPDYTLRMEIHQDVCGYGIGTILLQRQEGVEKPIFFISRLLTASEMNYSITEKECLGLVWAMNKFRPFIWGCKMIIITDHHALCWLMTKRELAGRLAR